jgi:hypothetical protein
MKLKHIKLDLMKLIKLTYSKFIYVKVNEIKSSYIKLGSVTSNRELM